VKQRGESAGIARRISWIGLYFCVATAGPSIELGCSSCNDVGCPAWTIVELEPPLVEAGEYRIAIEKVDAGFELTCTFTWPTDGAAIACTDGEGASVLTTGDGSGAAALRITSQQLASTPGTDVRLTLEYDGAELRAVASSLAYIEADRAGFDEDACDRCKEAHVRL
jgi:hypothetical protein